MTTLTIARKSVAGRTASKGPGYATLEGALHHETTREERYAAGKAMRDACPRRAHAVWKPPANRRDAVELVLAAEKGRMPELLPLRHGRMVRSAFTFYRGSALTMAADLASTKVTGVRVQCCGDAHLCNFGGFATPERRILFSINDLDETLPGPWEWDVKRLAASFVVACRDNGLSEAIATDTVLDCIRSYRESMAEFSEMQTMELWYASLVLTDIAARIKDPAIRERALQRIEKERGKSVAEDIFPKLVEHKGQNPFIKDQLPTIFHAEGHPPGEVQAVVMEALAGYRETLPTAYRTLLDRFELRDVAIKVVGIGSVGTRCWVLLFTAGDGDPMFLQVKEARASVLEPYAGASVFKHHGQRVVDGYRLMQPASDMFLGLGRVESRLLRAPAPGHEDQRQGRGVRARRHGGLRRLVRARPGPLPRALRSPGVPHRLHGQERHLRSGHRGVRRGLRRPERARPRRSRPRGEEGAGEGGLRRGEIARRRCATSAAPVIA